MTGCDVLHSGLGDEAHPGSPSSVTPMRVWHELQGSSAWLRKYRWGALRQSLQENSGYRQAYLDVSIPGDAHALGCTLSSPGCVCCIHLVLVPPCRAECNLCLGRIGKNRSERECQNLLFILGQRFWAAARAVVRSPLPGSPRQELLLKDL